MLGKETFDGMEKWIEEINEYKGNMAKIIIVGNKADLKDNREVSISLGEEFAERINAEFMEVSAKSDMNIQNILHSIIASLTNTKDFTINKDIEGGNY